MLKKIERPLDPYSPDWALYWEQNPLMNRGVGADGVNDDADDSDDDAQDGGDEGGDKDADEGGKDADKSDAGDKDNKGPSDAEAKLLKEVMSKKEKIKAQSDEIDSMKESLKKFDGVDMEEVKKLIQAQADAKTKDLEKKGDWDKLRQQMVDQQNVKTTELTSEIDALKQSLSSKGDIINKLTVGHSFDSSGYIGERLTLTPSKARIIYGTHFDVEEGNIVAYDKPSGTKDRTALVDGEGKSLGFEAAIAKIVDMDPDRDHIVKSKVKSGSDSKENASKAKDVKVEPKGVDKISQALSSGK